MASPGPGPCGPEADRAGPAHDSTAAHDSTTADDSTTAHDSTTADDATADDTAAALADHTAADDSTTDDSTTDDTAADDTAADDSTIDDWDYGTVTSTALSPSMRTLWGDSTVFCDAIASAIG